MTNIIEGIHPTRMELLEINKRITLATKGHKLLKEKRDTLVTEFFDIIREEKKVRKMLMKKMDEAYKNLAMAEAVLGADEVETLAKSVSESKSINIGIRNVMGVKLPRMELKSKDESKKYDEMMNLPHVSLKLKEAAENFDEVSRDMIKLAELQESLMKLGEEIKKTKRRVNALEYILIPRLKATRDYIRMRLEEMERENFFRLKAIKRKKERLET